MFFGRSIQALLVIFSVLLSKSQAYLSIRPDEHSVQLLLDVRTDLVAKMDGMTITEKAALTEIKAKKYSGCKKPCKIKGEVIDLIGDVHQKFHMTLNEPENGFSPDELAQLSAAFSLIEFSVQSVSYMKKFISLQLSTYRLLDDHRALSEEQVRLLNLVLPEVPHISLYKVVDARTVHNTLLDPDYGYVEGVRYQSAQAQRDVMIQDLKSMWKKLCTQKQMNRFIASLASKIMAAVPIQSQGDIELAFRGSKLCTQFKRDLFDLLSEFSRTWRKSSRFPGVRDTEYDKILRAGYTDVHLAFEGQKSLQEMISFMISISCASLPDLSESPMELQAELDNIRERIVAGAAEFVAQVSIPDDAKVKKVKLPKYSKSILDPVKTQALYHALSQGFSGITVTFKDSDFNR